MKHTPGPWQLNDLSIESANSGSWIACTDSRMGNDLAEDEANARLIAAAPDLLRALEEITRVMRANPQTSGLTLLNAMCEAAIKKAKGEYV